MHLIIVILSISRLWTTLAKVSPSEVRLAVPKVRFASSKVCDALSM